MNKRKIALFLSLVMLSLVLCGCGASTKSESAPAAAAEAYDYYSYTAEPAAAPAMMLEEKAEMELVGGINSYNTPAQESGATTPADAGKIRNEKIIYSCNAQLETVEYDKALEGVYAMVERFGGFVESSNISGSNYYRSARGLTTLRSASFTLRIPSEHFEELTGSLSELGNVPYCNTYTENITAQYYDVETRMEAYKIQEARLLDMLAIAESVDDMLAIQQQLTEVQYQIDSMQSRLTNYDRQVSYSTVYLNVNEVEKYTETPVVVLSYWEKMQRNFNRSLNNVRDFFVNASLWLGGNLPELICWIVGISLGIAVLKRIFRKRNRSALSRKERRAEKKAAKAAAKEAGTAEKSMKSEAAPESVTSTEAAEDKQN